MKISLIVVFEGYRIDFSGDGVRTGASGAGEHTAPPALVDIINTRRIAPVPTDMHGARVAAQRVATCRCLLVDRH